VVVIPPWGVELNLAVARVFIFHDKETPYLGWYVGTPDFSVGVAKPALVRVVAKQLFPDTFHIRAKTRSNVSGKRTKNTVG
jgi:hypothetical protein